MVLFENLMGNTDHFPVEFFPGQGENLFRGQFDLTSFCPFAEAEQDITEDQRVAVGVLYHRFAGEQISEQDVQGVVRLLKLGGQGLQGVQEGYPVFSCGEFLQVMPEEFENFAAVFKKFGDVFFKEIAAEIPLVIKTVPEQLDQVGGLFFGYLEVFGDDRIVVVVKLDIFIGNVLDFFLDG